MHVLAWVAAARKTLSRQSLGASLETGDNRDMHTSKAVLQLARSDRLSVNRFESHHSANLHCLVANVGHALLNIERQR